jgi:hypothetical protein
MKFNYTYLVAIGTILSMCGCIATYHKQELSKLPSPNGLYGGSFLYDPWAYHGSDQQYHYFVYTYNRKNIPHTKCIRIPKHEITLINIPERSPSKKAIAAVKLIIDSKGDMSGFENTTSIIELIKYK